MWRLIKTLTFSNFYIFVKIKKFWLGSVQIDAAYICQVAVSVTHMYMIILANFSFQALMKGYKTFKNLLEFYRIFIRKKQKYKQEKHSRNQARKRQL